MFDILIKTGQGILYWEYFKGNVIDTATVRKACAVAKAKQKSTPQVSIEHQKYCTKRPHLFGFLQDQSA